MEIRKEPNFGSSLSDESYFEDFKAPSSTHSVLRLVIEIREINLGKKFSNRSGPRARLRPNEKTIKEKNYGSNSSL